MEVEVGGVGVGEVGGVEVGGVVHKVGEEEEVEVGEVGEVFPQREATACSLSGTSGGLPQRKLELKLVMRGLERLERLAERLEKVVKLRLAKK